MGGAAARRLCPAGQLSGGRWMMCTISARRMQDIAERLGRGPDEIGAGCIARTAIARARRDRPRRLRQECWRGSRTYTMSLMAMVFLPSTFNRPVRRQPRRDPLATAGSIWGLAFLLDVSRCSHRWCCVSGYIAVNGCTTESLFKRSGGAGENPPANVGARNQ